MRSRSTTDPHHSQRQVIKVWSAGDEAECRKGIFHFKLGGPVQRGIPLQGTAFTLISEIEGDDLEPRFQQPAGVDRCRPVAPFEFGAEKDDTPRDALAVKVDTSRRVIPSRV